MWPQLYYRESEFTQVSIQYPNIVVLDYISLAVSTTEQCSVEQFLDRQASQAMMMILSP